MKFQTLIIKKILIKDINGNFLNEEMFQISLDEYIYKKVYIKKMISFILFDG